MIKAMAVMRSVTARPPTWAQLSKDMEKGNRWLKEMEEKKKKKKKNTNKNINKNKNKKKKVSMKAMKGKLANGITLNRVLKVKSFRLSHIVGEQQQDQ